jgi:hypothetical protein
VLLFLILGCFLFVAILATQSFNAYHNVFLRVLVSAGLFFACFLLLTIHARQSWRSGFLLGASASALLCFIFVTTDGYIHSVGIMADRTESLIVSRIVARVEANSETADPLPLVVIGRSHGFLGFEDLHEQQSVLFSSRPWLDATVSSFAADWSKRPVFRISGRRFHSPTNNQLAKACNWSRAMPSWPAKGSVLVREGIGIIKLGEPISTDKCPRSPRQETDG